MINNKEVVCLSANYPTINMKRKMRDERDLNHQIIIGKLIVIKGIKRIKKESNN